MKVLIELDGSLPDDEVHIRCSALTPEIAAVQKQLTQGGAAPIVFYKDDLEFFFPLDHVLFFETADDEVWAHTADDAYKIRQRLYELEECLPHAFIRVAKSTIVNTAKVYSIRRNLTSASLLCFAGTHKQVYASRHYYNALKERILERSNFNA